MPSKEPKNLMEEDKKDTPPADDVRWEVSCNERTRESREQKGEIARHVKVIVSAHTWADAKQRAFRMFAAEHQIYEPEDVEAFVLPDVPAAVEPEDSDDVPIRDEKGELLSPMAIVGLTVIKKNKRAKKKAAAATAKDKDGSP